MGECDVQRDRTWKEQWYCGIHGVWFRDADEPELCPAGEERERADELDSRLTKARVAMDKGPIPAVAPYPLPVVGDPPLSEYDRALQAGGRCVPLDERIERLIHEWEYVSRQLLAKQDAVSNEEES